MIFKVLARAGSRLPWEHREQAPCSSAGTAKGPPEGAVSGRPAEPRAFAAALFVWEAFVSKFILSQHTELIYA